MKHVTIGHQHPCLCFSKPGEETTRWANRRRNKVKVGSVVMPKPKKGLGPEEKINYPIVAGRSEEIGYAPTVRVHRECVTSNTDVTFFKAKRWDGES